MALEEMRVAEMTAIELKTLVQSAVRETLQDILGDPDAGLELRPVFRTYDYVICF